MDICINDSLTVEEYNCLRESVGWGTFPYQQVCQAFQQSVKIVSLSIDQKVVGMGRLIGDGIYYLIVDVVIDPIYQGKGLGKKILNLLIDTAYEDMIGERASIQLIAATGKESFYEKFGFERLPHDDSGCGMKKTIKRTHSS